MFLPKLGVEVEAVSSFSCTTPDVVNGEPLLSRSRHARVSVSPIDTSGLASSVRLAAASPPPLS